MKKFSEVIAIILKSKVLTAILLIVGVSVPAAAPWIGLNGSALVTSISAVLVVIGAAMAVFMDKPDIKNMFSKKVKK